MSVKGKILGLLLLSSMLISVIYISLFTESSKKNRIEIISVEGNSYLNSDAYINYAKLNKKNEYKYLSLHLIKDRIEKHPFVETAEVKFKSSDEVLIRIKEKKFEGIVIKDSLQFLITDRFELVPIVASLNNLDVPVISNPYLVKPITSFSKLKDKEIKTAFKIIETARIINPDLYSYISEVNLRDGRDIILTLRNQEFSVIVGRGNESIKIFYLNEIWNKIHNKSPEELAIDYIDLRFNNLIYIGMSDSFIVEKGV
jgi:cell division septal protein FtsQ